MDPLATGTTCFDQTPLRATETQSDKAVGKEPFPIPNRLGAALAILAEAYHYACASEKDVWEFALELPNLAAAGVSINGLRWLACSGYVRHGEEIESAADGRRNFRLQAGLSFTQRSCFILTQAGIEFAERFAATDSKATAPTTSVRPANGQPPLGAQDSLEPMCPDDDPMPHWDHERRELRIMGIVVKQFRLPSPNQETVLQVFEEEGWPARIDDPLPPISDVEPKRRLHDTIKSLNRHQKAKRIRFMGDGRGEGVLWEPQ